MKVSAKTQRRVLAIDPSKRGFGFAVPEGPDGLIDWSVKEVRQEKNSGCLKQIAILIDRYRPDVIVVEDYQAKDSRRCARIKELLEGIAALALSKKVRLEKVSRSAVKRAFSKYKTFNKHQIAVEIGDRFPELAAHVPSVRKPWMAEDARMNIFNAVAIALTLWCKG